MTKEQALEKINELQSYIESLDIPFDEAAFKSLEMAHFTRCENPFSIAKYPVTNELWDTVMGEKSGVGNLPKVNVSWNDAQEFIQKLNQITGKAYRLPTEYEWVLAATIDNTIYSGSDILYEVGWANDNLQPVGQKKPNSLGIYDMSGNVWEWCQNWYDENKKYRVLRGGSWVNYPQFCRCSYRHCYRPEGRSNAIGFRLVL